MSYFNTVPESDVNVKKYKKSAVTQEDKIINIFEYYERPMSPEEVWRNFENTPLTSIRRAMSNLSKCEIITDPDDMFNIIEVHGKLEMTGEKVKGMYGRMVNTWRLKNI